MNDLYPPGWGEERVRRVLEHYETQTDEEAVAEDEAAYEQTAFTAMGIPVDLVPAVRELLAKRESEGAPLPACGSFARDSRSWSVAEIGDASGDPGGS